MEVPERGALNAWTTSSPTSLPVIDTYLESTLL